MMSIRHAHDSASIRFLRVHLDDFFFINRACVDGTFYRERMRKTPPFLFLKTRELGPSCEAYLLGSLYIHDL